MRRSRASVRLSNIPLVQYSSGKAEINAIRLEEKRAAEAKALLRGSSGKTGARKAARLARHKSAAVRNQRQRSDAISRCAGAGQRETGAGHVNWWLFGSGYLPDNSAVIAAREAQARAVKQFSPDG